MECKNCGHDGEGKFCAACGQKLHVGRIKLSSILHDVVHSYTHFDKGFLYTLKELAIHPGTLQRNYLEGHRVRNQKPFPMFISMATICALALYLIYKPTPDATAEQYFYKHYYAITHAILIPVYALSTWLLFISSKLNFAEILVLILYMVGFMSLIVIPVNLLHFIFGTGITTLIEASLLAIYNIWTYLNFFRGKPSWLVAIKALVSIVFNYILFQIAGNAIIQFMM